MVTQLVKKVPTFYSVRMFKEPTTGLYPEPYATISQPPPYFSKIKSNIIFSYTPRSSEWSPTFRFTDQNFVCISHFFHACYMPCSFHFPGINHPDNMC